MRLQNKIALITGAAQGIGESTARLFVQEGAVVILCDVQEEKLFKLARELGENTLPVVMDVSRPEDWKKTYDTVLKHYNHIDVLFNNAGILTTGEAQDPESCSLEQWSRVHEVNLHSMFIGFKTFLPLLKNSTNASVINMSSRSGKVGVPQNAAYASSKAAIINFSKSIALFCAQKQYPIRCNSVLPAAIDTPLWDWLLGSNYSRSDKKRELARGIPLGKMGEPLDVAYAVLYLASDESKYITGTEIIIDGGILAGSSASPEKNK